MSHPKILAVLVLLLFFVFSREAYFKTVTQFEIEHIVLPFLAIFNDSAVLENNPVYSKLRYVAATIVSFFPCQQPCNYVGKCCI